MHPFTLVFLSFLLASVIVKLWLAYRQITHVQKHRHAVPQDFADTISLDAHQKAARYTCTRHRVSRVEMLLETLLLLFWTLGGGLNTLDLWWQQQALSSLQQGLAVIFSLIMISTIIQLPLGLYKTFVVEENYGFNQMRFKTWLLDQIKALVLLWLIGLPTLAALLWFMQQSGEYWWFYAWLFTSALSLLMIWVWPALIAPLFNRFTPLENPTLCARLNHLLQHCGFQSRGLFVSDGSKRSAHGNAYLTGLGRNKRIVFDDTLVTKLSDDEIEAVLAHELGHFKRHHIGKSIGLNIGLMFIGLALLAWCMNAPWFYRALGVENPSAHNALLLFNLALPVFTYFIHPLFSLLSRRHEFEADAFAHQNSDYRALTSALVHLYRDNASTLTPDPIYSMFYDSHPPAMVRIEHLKTIASEPT